MKLKSGQKAKALIANKWEFGVIVGLLIPDHYRIKIDGKVWAIHRRYVTLANIGYEWTQEKI
jgi:hypothetical protein